MNGGAQKIALLVKTFIAGENRRRYESIDAAVIAATVRKGFGFSRLQRLKSATLHYERHRPEQATLYRLVQQHTASFIANIKASNV